MASVDNVQRRRGASREDWMSVTGCCREFLETLPHLRRIASREREWNQRKQKRAQGCFYSHVGVARSRCLRPIRQRHPISSRLRHIQPLMFSQLLDIIGRLQIARSKIRGTGALALSSATVAMKLTEMINAFETHDGIPTFNRPCNDSNGSVFRWKRRSWRRCNGRFFGNRNIRIEWLWLGNWRRSRDYRCAWRSIRWRIKQRHWPPR